VRPIGDNKNNVLDGRGKKGNEEKSEILAIFGPRRLLSRYVTNDYAIDLPKEES